MYCQQGEVGCVASVGGEGVGGLVPQLNGEYSHTAGAVNGGRLAHNERTLHTRDCSDS